MSTKRSHILKETFAPFVLITVFLIKPWLIPSNTISGISFIGLCKSSVSNFGLASGCFMLSCYVTSSVRFRTPLSGFSESNLSALFMFPVLIKCAKVLLMFSGFLLFELLVSSLFCTVTHSFKSEFTFPSVQSFRLLWQMLFVDGVWSLT